ncbi:MAG: choice-of-anchor I family protein [Betaproteobacteria bacterium]
MACAGLLSACGGGDDPVEKTPVSLAMVKIAGFTHTDGQGGAGLAEIVAHDPVTKRLFVVNGAQGTLDVLDFSKADQPALIQTINSTTLWAEAGGINSVAVNNGFVALAVQASVKTNPGKVIVLRASDLSVAGSAEVGALPDMLTFTPDGKTILVANEGEPNSYGQSDSVDPVGSIGVIDVSGLSATGAPIVLPVRIAGFESFNSQKDALLAAGVRIFGPGARVDQDLEPEYITVSADGKTAYVTLQENNALAVVDIAKASVTAIKPLGMKDHSLAGQGMDVSNEDGGTNTNSGTPTIRIAPVPVKGLYMPDAIASYTVDGKTYLVTANEGDAREYTGIPGGREDPRVRDYCVSGFDTSVFGSAAATLGNDSNLGRLRITMFPGGTRTGKNNSGQCNELVAFGSRSFSIWDADAKLVFDSGDQLEQITKDLSNVAFNASNDNNTLDDRSPAKGPEPEAVVVGKFGSKHYAFIGLERVGGVVVYDVTNPQRPIFETYLNTRIGATGDRGPEGLALIKAENSPTGKPLLVVANETSGTTAVLEIRLGY